MCVALPMRVEETRDGAARVESGGARLWARLDLLERPPALGEYLLVHAGFAIGVLDEAEGARLLAELTTLAGAGPEGEGPAAS